MLPKSGRINSAETLYGLMYCLKAHAECQRRAQADVEVVRTDWSAGLGLSGKELSSVLIHAGAIGTFTRERAGGV